MQNLNHWISAFWCVRYSFFSLIDLAWTLIHAFRIVEHIKSVLLYVLLNLLTVNCNRERKYESMLQMWESNAALLMILTLTLILNFFCDIERSKLILQTRAFSLLLCAPMETLTRLISETTFILSDCFKSKPTSVSLLSTSLSGFLFWHSFKMH